MVTAPEPAPVRAPAATGARAVPSTCHECGADHNVDDKYCHECGTALQTPHRAQGPVTELRIVSVLFADLEGFTAFSAERDPEDVRDMLSKYFEVCRSIITRYGGVVEKFIGDAVMAVWGAPTAREGDSERAVRAALELLTAVGRIEVAPGELLRVRAGIVTGEAAVTPGRDHQGMVAGDVVNTASRIQSKAPSGRLYVDDTTHANTDIGVLYTDGGWHDLKGKPEPVHVWQAEGLAARVAGIEAPLVGRDAEIHVLKRAYGQVVEHGVARMVSFVGAQGLGKTRMAREFDEYLRGLADGTVRLTAHSAQFGEGAALGALAEIVRGLVDASPHASDSIEETVAAILEAGVSEAGDRAWLQPRLLQLLRPDPTVSFGQGELTSAWRRCIQVMATSAPLVLVFEELQWAGPELSEFLMRLVELSTASPILVLTLARPGADSMVTTVLGDRADVIELAPLSEAEIGSLVQSLVPEIDIGVRDQVVAHAEGVPLYAVETVRVLASRGVLTRADTHYVISKVLTNVEIPPSLQLLVSVRLDALPSDERRLLQTAAVIGSRFSASILGAVARLSDGALTHALGVLVREEVLGFDGSGGGRYYFTQVLLRDVAYRRLSKRERLELHLAAAGVLEAMAEHGAPEMIASHYIEAYRLKPELDEALMGARRTLVVAGDRAAALGAVHEAERYYALALDVTTDDGPRAELALKAGEMALYTTRWDEAEHYLATAISAAEAAHDVSTAAKARATLVMVPWNQGQPSRALKLARDAESTLTPETPPGIAAVILNHLAAFLALAGELDEAIAVSDKGCELAEWAGDPTGLAEALLNRAHVLGRRGRPVESFGLFATAHEVSVAADSLWAQVWVLQWEAVLRIDYGFFDEVLALHERFRSIAERFGNVQMDVVFDVTLINALYLRGDWDRALDRAAAIVPLSEAEPSSSPYRWAALIESHRGNLGETDRLFALVPEGPDQADLDFALYPLTRALISLDRRDYSATVDLALPVLEALHNRGSMKLMEEAMMAAVSGAVALGAWPVVAHVVDLMDSEWAGRATTSTRAHLALAKAHLATRDAEPSVVEGLFREAIAGQRAAGEPYHVAVALGEFVIWASRQGVECDDEDVRARSIFASLGARVWLDRLAGASSLAHAAGDMTARIGISR